MYRLFFILFSISFITAQPSLAYKKLDSIKTQPNLNLSGLEVDVQGNIYWLSNETKITKQHWDSFKKEWGTKVSFTSRRPIEKFSIDNAMYLVLKYISNEVQLLDNRLVPIQDVISFPLETNILTNLIHFYDNNTLWAYDPLEKRLILWDFRRNKVVKQKLLPIELQENTYVELQYRKNQIFLISDDLMVELTNQMNYLNSIDISSCAQSKVQANGVWCFNKESQKLAIKLGLIDLKLSKPKNIQTFAVNGNYLVFHTNSYIYLYQLKPESKK